MFEALEKWWSENKIDIKAQSEDKNYKGDFFHEWYKNYEKWCKYDSEIIMEYDNWSKIVRHAIKDNK